MVRSASVLIVEGMDALGRWLVRFGCVLATMSCGMGAAPEVAESPDAPSPYDPPSATSAALPPMQLPTSVPNAPPPAVTMGLGVTCRFSLDVVPPIDGELPLTVIARCESEGVVAAPQRIALVSEASVEMVQAASFLADVDFDGVLDLVILREFGAKWGRYDVRRFDVATHAFVENALTRALGELPNLTVDAPGRRLLAYDIGPAAPFEQLYRVDGDRLVLEDVCRVDDHGFFMHHKAGKLVERRMHRPMAPAPCLERHVTIEEKGQQTIAWQL